MTPSKTKRRTWVPDMDVLEERCTPANIGIFTKELDIGFPGVKGSASFDSAPGRYTVKGGGADIWDQSDQFHYLFKDAAGDATIIARVTSVQRTDGWAKAGVMFRDGTSYDSPHVMVVVTPDNGVALQRRTSKGGSSENTQVTGHAAPRWVRVTRIDDVFLGFYATTTGVPAVSDWTRIGNPLNIALPTTLNVGLAVTAHNNGALCTSTFTDVSVISGTLSGLLPGVTLPPPLPPLPFLPGVGPNDVIDAGHFQSGSNTEGVVLLGADVTSGGTSISVVDPLTGEQLVHTTTTGITEATYRILVGDIDADGVDELILFNQHSGPEGVAVRVVNVTTGASVREIRYDAVSAGQTYATLLQDLVQPEDEVFVGHFTGRTTNLEALFFNRTSQEPGSVSLRVIDLVTGELTDEGFHNGMNFGGWIDAADEVIISDTNFDGLDDLVFFNRVSDPENYRTTQTGFVGMVALPERWSGRQGSDIGFYRFFDWNFAKPDEQSVFPGYDDENDHASFGTVINNGQPTATMLLINSDSDGNPEAAAYAALEPAPLVQGTTDSFQLISTVFQPASTNTPRITVSGSFGPADRFLMADVTGDGSDEVIAYSPSNGGVQLGAFDAFSGELLGQAPVELAAIGSDAGWLWDAETEPSPVCSPVATLSDSPSPSGPDCAASQELFRVEEQSVESTAIDSLFVDSEMTELAGALEAV